MRDEEVLAKVTLVKGVKAVNVTAIVDTGADVSIISRRLAEKLGCLSEKRLRRWKQPRRGLRLEL
jgi:predicted aspartyl protease